MDCSIIFQSLHRPHRSERSNCNPCRQLPLKMESVFAEYYFPVWYTGFQVRYQTAHFFTKNAWKTSLHPLRVLFSLDIFMSLSLLAQSRNRSGQAKFFARTDWQRDRNMLSYSYPKGICNSIFCREAYQFTAPTVYWCAFYFSQSIYIAILYAISNKWSNLTS